MAAGRNKKRVKKTKHRAGNKCRSRANEEKPWLFVGTTDETAKHVHEANVFVYDTVSLKRDVWLDANDQPSLDPLTSMFTHKALAYKETEANEPEKLPQRIKARVFYKAIVPEMKETRLFDLDMPIEAMTEIPMEGLTEELGYAAGSAFKEIVMDEIARAQEFVGEGIVVIVWEEDAEEVSHAAQH